MMRLCDLSCELRLCSRTEMIKNHFCAHCVRDVVLERVREAQFCIEKLNSSRGDVSNVSKVDKEIYRNMGARDALLALIAKVEDLK